MERDQVIEKLRVHENELRRLGVLSVSIFGSVARDEQREESDLDLAVRFMPDVANDLMAMGGIAYRLEEILDVSHLDVADEDRLRPGVKQAFERDQKRAF